MARFSWQDKTVLITGATSGIGKATAILFAKNGFKVIVNGRNEDRGNEVAKLTGFPENLVQKYADEKKKKWKNFRE